MSKKPENKKNDHKVTTSLPQSSHKVTIKLPNRPKSTKMLRFKRKLTKRLVDYKISQRE